LTQRFAEDEYIKRSLLDRFVSVTSWAFPMETTPVGPGGPCGPTPPEAVEETAGD
jgi:hypothetical protein